ncbi:MAG: OmpA family protein [Bacteroidales bacterium]|nr:OmpA family protein [Bacteroidales bacterium]
MTRSGITDHAGTFSKQTGYCFILLVAGLLSFINLHSQQLKVYNINTGNFPDISANFSLYNEYGEFIYDLHEEEVRVKEDSLQREIIEFYNPSRHLLHTSIVMMLDISRSMTGERLQILKQAAAFFTDTLPLDITEVAIATFNNNVYLNCDFTQKTSRLRQTIQMIQANGETNYNNAFLSPHAGAIDIARHGFYKKKIIIFLTDGLANAHVAEIISKAQSENISVYCITVKLRMPWVLKKIAEETGGEWFEEINTLEMTKKVYSRIFEHAQSSTFGYIRWRSGYTCQSSVNLHLNLRGTSVSLCYNIPEEKRGRLESSASSLYFSDVVPGIRSELTTLFEVHKIPITILKIRNENPEFFGYKQTDLPVKIPADSSFQIQLYYMPADSGIRMNQFTISTKECGDYPIRAFGGVENRIQLIYPEGGEEFVPGMDTIISWGGVEESTNILLSVKNESAEKKWLPISESTGTRYSWTVPGDTGTKFRVKASALAELNKNSDLLIRTRISNAARPLFSANYSPDGNEIYTCDSSGVIKVWKESNGQLIKTLDRRSPGYVLYSPDNDRIVSLSGSGISIFTNRAGMYIGHVGSPQKKLFTSVISYNGKEYYSTATQEFYSVTPAHWKTGKNTGIWDPLQKTYLSLPSKKKYTEAAFSTSRLYAITLLNYQLHIWNTIKAKKIRKFELSPNFTSAIFNPAKNIISINNPNSIMIYDLDKNKNLLRITGEEYIRFSPRGNYIVTRMDGVTKLRCIADATLLKIIDAPLFIKFTADEKHLLYASHDSVYIFNLQEKRIHFKRFAPDLADASLNSSADKILLHTSDKIEIIDRFTNKTLFDASFRKNEFRLFVFSPQDENILSLTDDHEAVVWKPHIRLTEDSSGFFTILSPKPLIKDAVSFGEHDLEKPVEMIVDDYLENTCKFPVRIENIKIDEDKNQEFGIVSELPPYSVGPFSARAIELRFMPKEEGLRVASLTVITPTDSFKTVMKGTGKAHKYEIPSRIIDFGSIELFKEKDTLVSVFKNLTEDTIRITGIENTGPDTEQFSLLASRLADAVPPQDYLKLYLKFAPKYRGRTSGNIKLMLNNSKDNIDVSLFGEGKAPDRIFVYGKTLDSTDSIALEAAIKCYDLKTQRNTVDTVTGTDGAFCFYLRPERSYALVGEKDGYLSSSENIDLDKPVFQDSINQDVFLTGIKDKAMVKLNNIFFGFAKADLLETSFSDLNRILNLLKAEEDIRIEIHGHTDHIGSNESNRDLARRRAASVKNYLVLKGIDATRLKILSFGESYPVATNDTDEGRQLNRRVEIRIISNRK